MRFYRFAAVATAALLTGTASAETLTTGADDGQVIIDTNGFGTLGALNAQSSGSTGLYNPTGDQAAASTIYASGLFVGINGGARVSTASGQLQSFTGTDLSRTSVFTLGDLLSVQLVQTVSNLVDTAGNQTGSLLTQTYSFTNLGDADLSLDLFRYLDGDLRFDSELIDGGGRLTSGGNEILFETDTATGASDSATFVGIFNTGGTAAGFEIGEYSDLRTRAQGAGGLSNTIRNDADGDGFIDANRGYDVELALRNSLQLSGRGTGSFATSTIFGTGAPGQVVLPPPTGAVPEPATWAMMIGGFGLIGGAMRRRGQQAVVTA
ncbi:hypothetical protein GGR88_000863 [Sphingomonas jejuensis]|uniref:Ice-binding protein C-terminal domain-containing protein n=1 Tax=Sphingomonas jejuensis TaxID=904715 RepID=A0ABX0XJ84_9SPHN|nr:PEPxxWA-CTERM sorting domain-containing protein [Sphingomonas jejuensis]NJC33389.1 hypothetical protein [Sphingomonas jejuensis]